MILIFWFAMSKWQIPILDHMLQTEKKVTLIKILSLQ